MASSSLWVPNHSQQEPNEACNAFQVTASKLTGPPPSLLISAAEEELSLHLEEEGKEELATWCRSKREGNQRLSKAAFAMNGRSPQGGDFSSSQLVSWPLKGTLLCSTYTGTLRLGQGHADKGCGVNS